MATQKFSDLTATTTPNTESVFAIAHSGSNFKLTITDLAANLPAISATSLTTSGTITGSGGFIGNLTGNASTATALATGRTIGMTGDVTWTSASFDGSGNVTGTSAIGTGVIVNADINTSAAIDATKIHDGTISNTEFGYLNNVSSNIQTQLDSKASGVPTAITVADESSDTTCFPLFTTAATGDLGPKTASGLTFNSSTDVLSGTFSGNLTGNVTGNTSGTSGSTTGNAATATALETARNIGGVSFNGTANIDLPGVNSAGNQNTSGTAAIATTVTVADESSDTTCFPLFSTAATGDLAPKSGSNLTFNSSSGILTATGFAGALTGNVTGNVSGSSGSCTGNSATATSAATLTTARNIGGVSFNGSADINLPGVNAAGNQNTSGTAAGLSATLATSSGGTGLTGNVVGKHSIWIPASAMYPNTTNGCAPLAQVELSNGPELKVLDFDASADENAQFTVAFPKLWNEGTITFQAFFTVTGTNTGTVAWGLSGVAIADNDSINTAFGTNVVATAKAHSGTSNDLDVSAESGAVTIAGSPSVNETCYFQLMRDVSADTQTGDARLVGIKLFFTTDALTDD